MSDLSKMQIDEYYNALVNKDSNYIGIFYAGVITTSVFCIATCRARKPKKENVSFYTTFKDALAEGFRPCKICRPTENAYKAPSEIEQAIDLVRQHPKSKITDYILREKNISPDKVRRWFKVNYGLTFHGFQRMYRINNAFKELKDGKKTTDTAYDTGYESLSGFGYTYKKIMGNSPNQDSQTNIILISRCTSPLGPLFIGATDKGICMVEFTDRRMLETEFKDLQVKLKAKILLGENGHILQAKQELTEYFQGKRKSFTVALDTPGSDFQKKIWHTLQSIAYGNTISYAGQAKKINNPKAVRAVASANGNNRVAIIVPCHRVIGKDGSLTGYGGGLERKKWLLDFERSNLKENKA
jgi:AraC family transcriptional regulator of adaptative response/methylated-DNA-[protein]-cysteine methyltransferase